ncbi:AraC family transcriptional regulator [Thalassococcus sp. S3]|uniref:AraC family transcriptional regulator n=1 Tax=Thalassococcus sp. S3 TaxID=2017482 RepID=UPI0010244AA5|nr:AraC family transcriptional regulator [Thalassococcus sp. S3]QBF31417.1 AraC family transcriptional regulator [Thalassococcus sp. S3]
MGESLYHHLDWLHGIELFEAAFSTQTFSKHAHEGFAIGAIAEGVGGYLCRGETMALPTGSLSLMNPEEPHTGYAATPWLRYNMLYASEAAICSVLQLRSLRGFSTVAPKDRGRAISKGLSALASALHAQKSRDWHLRVEEAVYDVLSQSFVRYGNAHLPPTGREPRAISTLKERIFAGVAVGEDLSLSSLAEGVGLSASYLIRATRRQTGLTPHGLVLWARIEQAHRLLLREIPAAEAAYMAGFYDQSHMIRQYRRHYGVTPGAVIRHS